MKKLLLASFLFLVTLLFSVGAVYAESGRWATGSARGSFSSDLRKTIDEKVAQFVGKQESFKEKAASRTAEAWQKRKEIIKRFL